MLAAFVVMTITHKASQHENLVTVYKFIDETRGSVCRLNPNNISNEAARYELLKNGSKLSYEWEV